MVSASSRFVGNMVVLALLVAMASAASAQGVIEVTEHVDFDRPEAWALKYFAAASHFSAFGAPRRSAAGELELGFELGWIPSLDEDQRRVGFNGTKVEDINRISVLVRPRLRAGLGRGWALDMGWLPPVEISGVRSNLLSVALERVLADGDRWTLGVRAVGQLGEVKGDFTCSEDDAAQPPGSPANEFGCEEPSRDTATLDGAGLAVLGGLRVGDRGARLHLGATAMYNDMEFQVDALTYGIRDRTLLLTDGWTYSVTAGASLPVGERIEVVGELYYSPLGVRRAPAGEVENDPMLNLRALIRWRL